MRYLAALGIAALGLAGCAFEGAEPTSNAEAGAAASGSEAPVIVRLRTRSGTRDVSVNDLATAIDGHRLDAMQAWADTDPELMREAPADELAAPPL